MTRLLMTWAQLFGQTFEESYNPDPENLLELTEDQRYAAKYELENYVDEWLKPFDAYILGNGDIIGAPGEKIDWNAFKEYASMFEPTLP